jgi:hypothetical protein
LTREILLYLDQIDTQHLLATAADDIAIPSADGAAVQAMVAAVRLRRTVLKEARSVAILNAAPKPIAGFRDMRRASDSPWARRFRSARIELVMSII